MNLEFGDLSRIGLLFDDAQVIARFKAFTCENHCGERTLSGIAGLEDIIRLREAAFPSPEFSSPKLLRAVYVEYNRKAGENAPGKLIEDFGLQYINGIVVEAKPDWRGFEAQLWVMKYPRPRHKSRHPALARLRHLRARQLY